MRRIILRWILRIGYENSRVDGAGLGSCLVAGFGISGAFVPSSTNREFVEMKLRLLAGCIKGTLICLLNH